MDWKQAAQEAEHLARLLEHPEPGLFTWLALVGTTWRALGDALHWPSIPSDAELRELEARWRAEAER